ncbi:MAG TPA: hypothetical protein VJH88_03980 [Candidatus Nanoarchaeia archaeon]|nr:hypothetical protein [Candidatus Nanoarchaeia archaeon]
MGQEHEHTYAVTCRTTEAAERFAKKIKADCTAGKTTVLAFLEDGDNAGYVVRSSENYDRMPSNGTTIRRLQRDEIEPVKDGMHRRALEHQVRALTRENDELKKAQGNGYLTIDGAKTALNDIGDILNIQPEFSDAATFKGYCERLFEAAFGVVSASDTQKPGEKTPAEYAQKQYEQKIASLETQLASSKAELENAREDSSHAKIVEQKFKQAYQRFCEEKQDLERKLIQQDKELREASEKIIPLNTIRGAADNMRKELEQKYKSELDTARREAELYKQKSTELQSELDAARKKASLDNEAFAHDRNDYLAKRAEYRKRMRDDKTADEVGEKRAVISVGELRGVKHSLASRILIPDPEAQTTPALLGYIAFKRISDDDAKYVASAFEKQGIMHSRKTGRGGTTKIYRFGPIEAALEEVVDELQPHAGTIRPRDIMMSEIREFFTYGEQCGNNPELWKPDDIIRLPEQMLKLALGARNTISTVKQKLKQSELETHGEYYVSVLAEALDFNSPKGLQRPREVYKQT